MLESSNIISAIFFCIGAHYIFNLNYHPKSGKFQSLTVWYFLFYLLLGDVWLLIQEKVLAIRSKSGIKRHPSSTSHFSGISRVYESLSARMAVED